MMKIFIPDNDAENAEYDALYLKSLNMVKT